VGLGSLGEILFDLAAFFFSLVVGEAILIDDEVRDAHASTSTTSHRNS